VTIRRALATFLCSCWLASFHVHAAPAKQFEDIVAVGDFTNDFSVEQGNLKVLKKTPLHFQLSIPSESSSDLAAEAMFRAFLWGVYRTFLHTKVDQVTITVVSATPVNGTKQMTASSTRLQALSTVQQIPGISGWNDLLTDRQTWSEPMKRCVYSTFGKPGIRDCALRAAGKI